MSAPNEQDKGDIASRLAKLEAAEKARSPNEALKLPIPVQLVLGIIGFFVVKWLLCQMWGFCG